MATSRTCATSRRRRDASRPSRRASSTCAVTRRAASCSTSAATSARSSRWPRRRASRSRASSPRAGPPSARARGSRPRAPRRRRGRPLPEGAYDVVTMWDVIEHLPDPASTLRAVHSALRPGGVFAVTTMDVDALFPRVAGRFWPWYMQMHLVYFSRRTLGELLRRSGFEVVEVTRHRRIVRVSYAVSRHRHLQPHRRAGRARVHAPVRRAQRGHRSRRHRHRGGAQATGLMVAPAQRRADA